MSDLRKDPRFARALYDPQFHKFSKSKKQGQANRDKRFSNKKDKAGSLKTKKTDFKEDADVGENSQNLRAKPKKLDVMEIIANEEEDTEFSSSDLNEYQTHMEEKDMYDPKELEKINQMNNRLLGKVIGISWVTRGLLRGENQGLDIYEIKWVEFEE